MHCAHLKHVVFSTKIKENHHLQGNVQVYNVRIPVKGNVSFAQPRRTGPPTLTGRQAVLRLPAASRRKFMACFWGVGFHDSGAWNGWLSVMSFLTIQGHCPPILSPWTWIRYVLSPQIQPRAKNAGWGPKFWGFNLFFPLSVLLKLL